VLVCFSTASGLNTGGWAECIHGGLYCGLAGVINVHCHLSLLSRPSTVETVVLLSGLRWTRTTVYIYGPCIRSRAVGSPRAVQ